MWRDMAQQEVYLLYRRDNAEHRQTAFNKRRQLLEFKKSTLPRSTAPGSAKSNESLRKSLARRHLPCSYLMLARMTSMSGLASLKTTSLHQKIRMMDVHMSG
jgi:hypothetical protein